MEGKDGMGKRKRKDEGKGFGKNADKDVECYYWGKKGYRKSDCRKRKTDLEKGGAEGKPEQFRSR